VTRDTPSPATGPRSLAARHVPLVAHLVRETMSRVPAAVDRNDLRAAGLSALLDAARAIEMTPDRSFVTRASAAIRGALVDELRTTDWAARAARPRGRGTAAARLAEVLDRLPDRAAAERALDMHLDDAPAPDRDPVSPLRTGRAEHEQRRQCLALALDELPERLRHVIRGYFLDQRPMADLAAEIGASEARAVRLRADALAMLRDGVAAAFEPQAGDASGSGDASRDDAGRRAYARAYARALAVQCAARREQSSGSSGSSGSAYSAERASA